MTRIKELRLARGFESQRAFASFITKHSGYKITYGTISQLEKGTANPVWETVDVLATFFGVSTDYLMGRNDKKVAKK